jgi:hypothetical protein
MVPWPVARCPLTGLNSSTFRLPSGRNASGPHRPNQGLQPAEVDDFAPTTVISDLVLRMALGSTARMSCDGTTRLGQLAHRAALLLHPRMRALLNVIGEKHRLKLSRFRRELYGPIQLKF